ncbi:delta and Notch-like epidermal growth factor-related receptor isoform X2 [Argopecten irradians]|uniref:delta and Notch-like epidermal growth factor-related receptor isoform X2 n=1 Tax=Argopecten irradians TaxID=31199 RepID=UPI0037210A51
METNILICLTIIIAACCTQCVGICIPPCTGNFVCSGSLCDTCNTGFYGNDCTDTCEDSGAASCQNGGTCGASSPRSCSCTSGFTGTLCDTESNIVPPVRKHPCN